MTTRNDNPRTPRTSKSTAANGLANGLGALVTWDLFSAFVTPAKLSALLTDNGMDATIVPAEVDQAAAVRSTASGWTQGRGKADRYKSEVVYDDNGRIEVGILRRERLGPHRVRWEQVDVVTFDTGAEDWMGTSTSEASQVFKRTADRNRTHLDCNWVRSNVIDPQLSSMGACKLRRLGGVVYVPVQHLERLARLQTVVENIGASEFSVIHAAPTESSRKAIAGSTQRELRSQLDELLEQLGRWESSSRRVREDAADSALVTFCDLKARAELYQDALAIRMDELTGAIDAAEQRAREIIDGQVVDYQGQARTVKHATVAIWRELLAQAEDHDGQQAIPVEALVLSGLTASAWKQPRYYAISQPCGKALLALGYRGKLILAGAETRVELRAARSSDPQVTVVGGPQEDEATPAA